MRIDRARKEINDQTRNKVKSALKAARLAVAAGDSDVKAKIDAAFRQLDIAAKKNVIHKNKASRLKARLAKKLSKSNTKTETPAKPVKKTLTKKPVAKKK